MQTMVVDIHGMSVEEARRFLVGKIEYLPKGYGSICVIHGFRAGTRLQQFVRNGLKHNCIKRKILTMNQGETILMIEKPQTP